LILSYWWGLGKARSMGGSCHTLKFPISGCE
jgi:hypothetical protein